MSEIHTPHHRPTPIRRTIRRIGMLALAAVLAGAAAVPLAAPQASAARVIHVSPLGSDGASGDASNPVRTVGRAVKMAAHGDVVEIASGNYHESVQVYGKAVHLRAAAGANVVFDGAIPVNGWSASGGLWTTAWRTDFARASTPHVYKEQPESGWPEQFFLDGVPLTEVTSRSAVVPGTFFHDPAADLVWIGDNPTGRLVEGSSLGWGIYLNKAHGSSLRNITVQRYATPYTHMAAVRAYSNDLVLDGVTARLNAYMGISVIGDRVDIVNSVADRNGHLGIHAHLANDVSVRSTSIVGNNYQNFDAWHAAGGLKMTETAGITVIDSYVADNKGPGLWTDLDAHGVHMARNYVTRNARSGIELELSFDIVVVDNVVTDNAETGVWVLESHNPKVWHNALFANKRDIWVEDGPRSDVNNVELFANTLGGYGPGGPALLNVEDWTKARSASAMNVRADHNAYWLPPSAATRNVSMWADWPRGIDYSTDLASHRAATGFDSAGVLRTDGTNPYVRNEAAIDYRIPAGYGAAAALSADVAAVAGVPAGSAHPAGPISAWRAPAVATVAVPGAIPAPTPGPASPASGVPTTPTTQPVRPGTAVSELPAVRIPVDDPDPESFAAAPATTSEPAEQLERPEPVEPTPAAEVADPVDAVPVDEPAPPAPLAGWRTLNDLVVASS